MLIKKKLKKVKVLRAQMEKGHSSLNSVGKTGYSRVEE
jgi:hypothetical protein